MRVHISLFLMACAANLVLGQQRSGGDRSRAKDLSGGKDLSAGATRGTEDRKLGKLGERPKPKDVESMMADRKASFDMEDLKALGRDRIGKAMKQMNMTERDAFCIKSLKGGADEDTMKNLKENGADCLEALKRDRTMMMKGGEAEVTMKEMKRMKPPSQWNESDWGVALRQMPDAVKASDLRQMDRDTVKKMVEGGDFQQGRDAFKQPSKRSALQKQLKSAYGEPDSWDKDAIEKMGPLMGSMEPSDLRRIPKDKIKEAAASMRDVEYDDARKRAAAGDRLLEGLGKKNAKNWTADDIINADQYIRDKPSILKDLSDESLRGSIESLGRRPTGKKGASQIGRRLKSMDEYKNPANLDKAKVEKMGHLMQGMGKEYLKDLPTNAVEGALGTLANVSFSRGDARELVGKIKGKSSQMTSDRMKELGHLVKGLGPEDFAEMPDSVIADSLSDLVDKDFDVGQCRAIVKKAKSAGKQHMKKMGKLMSKCMTPDDLSSASIEDLGLNCNDDTPPSFTPTKAQAQAMFKKVAEQFGEPSSSNSYYTLTCMKNWGPVAGLGMSPTDFENIPDTADLDAIFEVLSGFEGEMDDAQTKAIAKRLRSHLQLDNETAASSHDSTRIERVGKFLKHFAESDLDKFSAEVKPDIARKIGEANTDRLTHSEKKRMKNFALKHVRSEDGSQIRDRRSASTLESNDVQDMGSLFGGLEEADLKKMSSSAIEGNLVAMNDKIRGLAEQGAVWSTAKAKEVTFFDNSANIIGASGLAGGIPDDIMTSLNKNTIGEGLLDASDMLQARKARDGQRDTAGYRSEISDDDRAAMENKIKGFVQKGFSGYKEAQTTTTTTRRRRSTYTLTCADVQALGSSVDSLSATDLSSLSTTEFKNCVESLGGITSWSSSQLAVFSSKLIAAYGSTISSWATADIKLMGSMIASLTDSQISSLTLTSSTIFSTMGRFTGFTSAQLSAGYSAFLQQTYNSDASQVTGDDLINMGTFVCGIVSSNSGFSTSTYKAAAASIGGVTCLSESAMTIYATLAKSAYGASSTWDSATITTVGNVIGGLSTSEIGALTSTQISSISPTTISVMPVNKVTSFSSSQLSSLTTSQANSFTNSQQQSMSVEQKTALVNAGATNVPTSGAPGLPGRSVFLLLLALGYLMF